MAGCFFQFSGLFPFVDPLCVSWMFEFHWAGSIKGGVMQHSRLPNGRAGQAGPAASVAWKKGNPVLAGNRA
jgi:hypothetical protein